MIEVTKCDREWNGILAACRTHPELMKTLPPFSPKMKRMWVVLFDTIHCNKTKQHTHTHTHKDTKKSQFKINKNAYRVRLMHRMLIG